MTPSTEENTLCIRRSNTWQNDVLDTCKHCIRSFESEYKHDVHLKHTIYSNFCKRPPPSPPQPASNTESRGNVTLEITPLNLWQVRTLAALNF
jgi:hypothetical protein